MEIKGNTILITGGGSGIGRGLAEQFHKLGNTVIIAGRRKENLVETTAANPGMHFLQLDIDDPENIKEFGRKITAEFPKLNVVINNAGIMRPENLKARIDYLKDAEAIVSTNLLGPIRLTAALLPALMSQAKATIMTVSSGLAYVPLAFTPTYCATKAAIHSYSESLRFQLKDTSVEVIELVPPYVQTDLMDGAKDPRAMSLKDYIAEVMQLISKDPSAKQICVERVKPLRMATETGKFEETFQGLNTAMAERFLK